MAIAAKYKSNGDEAYRNKEYEKADYLYQKVKSR
jgi:hypothetical protein